MSVRHQSLPLIFAAIWQKYLLALGLCGGEVSVFSDMPVRVMTE
jgi:hypothetical protein